jgi:HlyD family secretion protein
MMRQVVAMLVGVGVLLGAALPLAATEEAAATAPAPTLLPAITVARAVRADLADRVIASGQIQPVEQIFVQPQIEGQAIDEILVDVGDTVETGQVLVRLAESDLKLQRSQLVAQLASARAQIAQGDAQIIEARANRDEAARVWERTRKLRDQGTVAQASADQAQATAQAAEARVTMAEETMSASKAQLDLIAAQIADVDLRLDRTGVIAPVGGRIVERNAQVGSIATASSLPMFVIVRDGQLELRADVAEQDVLRLAPGQKAALRAVGLAAPLSGVVRLVEPTVSADTRLGRVRIAIDASDKVVSGLFAEAAITVASRSGVAVPVTAVATAAEGASLLVVDEAGRVERRAVVTGIRDGAMLEIIEGVAEGERVVAKAGAFVRDGDIVRPVDPAATN